MTHRRSWLAVPIDGARAGDTIGVVFMDSSDPDLFADDVQRLAVGATVGWAKYIRER